MARLLKYLFMLALVAGLGAAAFVYFTEVPPIQQDVVQKVSNDVLFQK